MTTAFRITADDHATFVAASGDRSPLHVDPVAARRRFPGEPVVHGVHVLLRVVDAAVVAGVVPAGVPRTLRATFVRPVLPGDEVIVEGGGGVLRALVDGAPVAVVHLDGEVVPSPVRTIDRPGAAVRRGPTAADLRLEQLPGRDGLAGGAEDPSALADLVPAAVALLGHGVVEDLAAASAVVGMDCPGRRALLADVAVTLMDGRSAGAGAGTTGIAWRVERTVPAVSRAVLAVSGAHVVGRLGVLVVPDPPVLTVDDLAGVVGPGEFDGLRPLVVGGSRGLGATAVRLLALGGADVLVGWRTEAGPAEAVVADVRRAGGRARAVHVDVTDPAGARTALAAEGWDGDEVLVFASPRILRRHLGGDRPALLDELRAVHVAGPVALVRALADLRGGRLVVGYPSSVAIDETPDDMREYARAKAEAEAALAALAAEVPGVRVVVRRLPRIETEQTVAFTPAPAADAATELLPLLRAVRDARPMP